MIQGSLAAAHESDDYESAARASTSFCRSALAREGLLDELADWLDAGFRFTREHAIWSHSCDLEVHQAQLDLHRGNWALAAQRMKNLHDSTDAPGMFAV
ncbi:hypothetical protein [Kribbella sp. CA-294648]|uniref:hypothetical protein n=1 Tax=Kribbella sp. CA-294648 TaxID=3239948 RepID=UPI003D937429